MFDVMTKPIQHALFVDPDKTEEFLEHKVNIELKKQILERGRKLQEQIERCENEIKK